MLKSAYLCKSLQATIKKRKRAEYILPPYWLLDEHKRNASAKRIVEKNAKLVEDTLKIFAVEAKVVNVSTGPTITI